MLRSCSLSKYLREGKDEPHALCGRKGCSHIRPRDSLCKGPGVSGSMTGRFGERRGQGGWSGVYRLLARELNGPEVAAGLVGRWKNLGFDLEDMRHHWGVFSREAT